MKQHSPFFFVSRANYRSPQCLLVRAEIGVRELWYKILVIGRTHDAHFKNDQTVGEWNITRSETKARNTQGVVNFMAFVGMANNHERGSSHSNCPPSSCQIQMSSSNSDSAILHKEVSKVDKPVLSKKNMEGVAVEIGRT
jgi:hypothetical protein